MLLVLFVALTVGTAQVLDVPDVPWTGFSWRKWPDDFLFAGVPAWGNYIAYLAIVFNAPTIAAIALLIMMCVGCCVCRMCSAPYSDAKRTICFIVYTLLFILFILMIIGAVSFALFAFSSYEVVKKEGDDLLKKIFNIPTDIRLSLTEIVGLIPDIENNVLELLAETDRLEDPFRRVSQMVTDARWALDNGPTLVDQMNTNYTYLIDRVNDLVALGWSSTLDEMAYTFPAPTTIFLPVSEIVFTSLDTIATTGVDGIDLAQFTINMTIGTFTDVINGTVWEVKDVLDDVLVGMVEGLDSAGVNEAFVDKASTISLVVEIILVVIVVFVYLIFAFSYLTCYCCLNRCGQCLAISSCTACCGVWWLMALGGLFVCIFFLADDVCRQGENTFRRSSQWLPALWGPILNITVPVIGGDDTMNIDLIHSAMNVLYCGQPESNGVQTFIEAYGLTLAQLNATSSLTPYTELFTNALQKFDVIGTVTDMFDILSNFSTDISGLMPTTFEGDRIALQAALDAEFDQVDDLDNFYATELGYDQMDEITKRNQLNAIMDANCDFPPYDIGRVLIISFNLSTAPYDVDCSSMGAGDRDTVMLTLRPVLYGYSAAYYSDTADYARQNLTALHQAMAALTDAETAARAPVDALLATPNLGSVIMADVQAGYDALMYNISGIVPNVMSSIDSRLADSPIFSCSEVGSFYSSLKKDGCGVGVTSLGFVGFMTVGMALVNFLFFWVILYFSSMLIDRSKNTEYQEYSDERPAYRWSDSGSFTDVSSASSGFSSSGEDW